MEDLAGVFAEVLVAVVDLPVDVSAGFLLLSGCFLSSALTFVLSAESAVKHTNASFSPATLLQELPGFANTPNLAYFTPKLFR